MWREKGGKGKENEDGEGQRTGRNRSHPGSENMELYLFTLKNKAKQNKTDSLNGFRPNFQLIDNLEKRA